MLTLALCSWLAALAFCWLGLGLCCATGVASATAVVCATDCSSATLPCDEASTGEDTCAGVASAVLDSKRAERTVEKRMLGQRSFTGEWPAIDVGGREVQPRSPKIGQGSFYVCSCAGKICYLLTTLSIRSSYCWGN